MLLLILIAGFLVEKPWTAHDSSSLDVSCVSVVGLVRSGLGTSSYACTFLLQVSQCNMTLAPDFLLSPLLVATLVLFSGILDLRDGTQVMA